MAQAFANFLKNWISLEEPARTHLGIQGWETMVKSFVEINTTDFYEMWESFVKMANAMRWANEADHPIGITK